MELQSSREDDAPDQQQSNPWRYELSERLEKLRERRERARKSFDPGTSLELGFGAPSEHANTGPAASRPLQMTGAGEHSRDSKGSRKQQPIEHGPPIEDRVRLSGSNRHEGDDWSEGVASSRSMELDPFQNSMELVGSRAGFSAGEDESIILHAAPLGRRFLAGLLDAMVLLVAGGVFALIFQVLREWGAPGPIAWNRVDTAILGLLAVVLIMAYFGLFAALSSSTPGMLLMDLEVVNMDGDPPTASDSILRALGYLVSLSALMLGFIWAAVDSEGLTWHDRMSGTLVTVRSAK